jgi:hypothetical protein
MLCQELKPTPLPQLAHAAFCPSGFHVNDTISEKNDFKQASIPSLLFLNLFVLNLSLHRQSLREYKKV